MNKEKNLELERLVFFSDAVVAIAITLLALDLKLEKTGSILTFQDMGSLWPKFFAFLLSFVLIAVFWKVHHEFFSFIQKMDYKIFWYNLFWLLFIITLPFSTSLVSSYYGQSVSIFVYSINTLLITIFQNQIWDHVAVRPDYLNAKATKELIYDNRVNCNVAMFNAILAAIISFIIPGLAFLILFLRPVMMNIVRRFLNRKK
jgi:uncharacterized membrane protein